MKTLLLIILFFPIITFSQNRTTSSSEVCFEKSDVYNFAKSGQNFSSDKNLDVKSLNPKLVLQKPKDYFNSSPFFFFDVNLCYNITTPKIDAINGAVTNTESKSGFKASILGSVSNILGPLGFSGGLVLQNSKINFTLQPGLIPDATEANINRNSLNIPFGFNIGSEKYSDFLYSFDIGLNPQIILSNESSFSGIDISKSDLGIVFGVSAGYKTFQAFGMNVGLLGAINYSAGLRNLSASGNFINSVKSNIFSISLGARFIPFTGSGNNYDNY